MVRKFSPHWLHDMLNNPFRIQLSSGAENDLKRIEDYYISKYEVTVGEFKQFIDATNYPTDAEKGTGDWSGSWVYDGKEWNQQKGINLAVRYRR